jgi:hypothetical protein
LVFDRTQNNQALHVDTAAGGGRSSVGKQISRDGDLGHLERDVAAMADDLRANFDELLFQVVIDQSSHGEVRVKGRFSRA